MSSFPAINLQLHDKQSLAITSRATEILYGGAAGGGKSHLMRVAAILWCSTIPGLQVYLFRRIREDLIKTHIEGPQGFRSLLAPLTLAGYAAVVGDEVRFWNGSRIYLCHCKDEKDVYKYLSVEMHVLLIDELTQFTDAMYRFLRNRVRMVGLELPAEYAGCFPRILASSNPGNVGHLFVRETFVEQGEYDEVQQAPDEGGMLRQFIPARLEDNPSMASDDPGYENRLMGLGSKALVKAMRYGDWDVIEGAFFDCWDNDRHVIRPFELPRHWMRFRSMDWGSAKPFSIGWWGIASDTTHAENKMGQRIIIPRGAMVRYREWYGKEKANVGLKMKNGDIGRGIKEREAGEDITYGVLDTACFAEHGGPSIEEQMRLGGATKFREADKTRVATLGSAGGWSTMRDRLLGDADNNAMIVCFSTCLDSIRTIPSLMHDDDRMEDLDTDGEDHAADEWRYACMSRPWVRTKPEPKRKQPKDYTSVMAEGDSWR